MHLENSPKAQSRCLCQAFVRLQYLINELASTFDLGRLYPGSKEVSDRSKPSRDFVDIFELFSSVLIGAMLLVPCGSELSTLVLIEFASSACDFRRIKS